MPKPDVYVHETRKVELRVVDGPKVTEDDGTVKQIAKVVFDTILYGNGEANRWVYAYTEGGTTVWNGKRAALRLLRQAGYDIKGRDLNA